MLDYVIIKKFDNNNKKYEHFNNIFTKKQIKINNRIAIALIIIINIYSCLLAFFCNKKSGMILRILYSIFAFLFGSIYLIYYFFVHIILNYKC
jgi:hypothetical protein